MARHARSRQTFAGDILSLDSETQVKGNATTNRQGALGKETVIKVGSFAPSSKVIHCGDSILALTEAVGRGCARRCLRREQGIAVVYSRLSRGGIGGRLGSRISRKNLGVRLVIALKYVVGKAVELIPKFKVVRASPSALEPGKILIDLDRLVGIACGHI